MVRVLHLLSCTPDFQAQRGAAALGQGSIPDLSITTRTVGRGGDFRNPLDALLKLRGKAVIGFDAVHVWDFPTLLAAAGAGARRVVFSPSSLLRRPLIRSLLRVMHRWPVELVCQTPAEQRAYVVAGVPPRRCHVIAPGVDCTRLGPRRDPVRREALGFAEHDFVLFAPGESTRHAGHRDALWTVSILHVLQPASRALLWGRGSGAIPLLHLAEKLRQPRLLTMAADRAPEELISAADAALFVAPGATPLLPLAMCMSARLPVIASASRWTNGVLQDGSTAATVPRRSPRMLAQRVLELRHDAGLQSSIASGAGEAAQAMFSMAAFLAKYRALYHGMK